MWGCIYTQTVLQQSTLIGPNGTSHRCLTLVALWIAVHCHDNGSNNNMSRGSSETSEKVKCLVSIWPEGDFFPRCWTRSKRGTLAVLADKALVAGQNLFRLFVTTCCSHHLLPSLKPVILNRDVLAVVQHQFELRWRRRQEFEHAKPHQPTRDSSYWPHAFLFFSNCDTGIFSAFAPIAMTCIFRAVFLKVTVTPCILKCHFASLICVDTTHTTMLV